MCKSNWKINEVPEDCVGFVYKITNKQTKKFYIGKKSFYSRTSKKVKGRTNKKWTVKESNWRSYCSSSKELQEDIKSLGIENFEFEILELCKSKRQMSYFETNYQFLFKVLETNSYNKNILGKFFRL